MGYPLRFVAGGLCATEQAGEFSGHGRGDAELIPDRFPKVTKAYARIVKQGVLFSLASECGFRMAPHKPRRFKERVGLAIDGSVSGGYGLGLSVKHTDPAIIFPYPLGRGLIEH